MLTPDDVLEFWIGAPLADAPAAAEAQKRWFMGGADLDRAIRERFGADIERAAEGAYDAWTETARGRLALVILLDQFSRNAFRGTPKAFAQDAKARQIVQEGIARGHDRGLGTIEALFFGLPIEHAEDLALQHQSVAWYEKLAADAPPHLAQLAAGALDFAKLHRDVIERFGRYPQRNQALGRTTTPEEQVYLDELARTGRAF
jgi:uncharacterized protein (DUF924 family)